MAVQAKNLQCCAQGQISPMSYFHLVKRNPLSKMDLSLSCLFEILNSLDFEHNDEIQPELDSLDLPQVLETQLMSLMHYLAEADIDEKMSLVCQGYKIPLYCICD